MSNEQQWPQPQPESPTSAPPSPPGSPSFQPGGPSFQRAPSPSAPSQHGPYPSGPARPGSPNPAFQPGYGPQQAPPPRPASYPSYQQPSPAPTRRQRRGVGVAGVLTIALLAAGIGGGSGFVASRYLEPATSANTPIGSPTASPTSETTEASSQQITVVQADPTNPDWAAVAEVASKAVVAIQVAGAGSGSQGSGVIIDGEGHIVTNNHVVASAQAGAQISVLLGTTAYQAEPVGYDPSTDLAVIKMTDPPSELSVMGYGDSKALKVGDPVMAIGNPLGLADTVTTGIVSALNRPVTTRAVTNETVGSTSRDNRVVTAAIQTNAAINPGNSGGALVNTAGELIGITSSIASLSRGQEQAGNIGIGFAIGSDQVEYVVEQLIDTGEAQHPQLGVVASDVQTYGPMGAEIVEVVASSPAEEAGLQVGDQVTTVDGQPVNSTESLVALVRAGRIGEEMQLTLLRNGEELTLTVIPIAAPS